MANQFEIKTLKAQPTLYMHKTLAVGELPQFFGQAFGGITRYMGTQGIYPASAPYAYYKNMDMQALEIEAGFPLIQEIAGNDDIQAGELPAGKYASGQYVGPYDKMAPFYEDLKKWAEDQGYETVGTAYEWYFSGPEVPPEQAVTDVWLPLK
jgi:effector-binding domain-containing protein